jgi:hypothetical protein
VVCIDPHARADGAMAARPALGEEHVAAFRAHLASAGVSERLRHVRAASPGGRGTAHDGRGTPSP